MTRGWTLYLRARGTLALVMLACADLALVLASGITVFEITLVEDQLPRFTPTWEALPVLLGVTAPALLAPRLGSWELLGQPRLRWRASTVAVAAALVPAVIPWVAHLRLPADARWWDISCNVTFFAATALIATAILGALPGPLIGLLAYLATIAIQQTMPGLAEFLPVSGAKTNLTAHPIASLAMTVLAALVWAATLGKSRFARNLYRND